MDEIEIPASFWRTLSTQEFMGIFKRDGLLTRAQSLRAWQMAGRVVAPSGRIRIVFDRAEIERYLQTQTRH